MRHRASYEDIYARTAHPGTTIAVDAWSTDPKCTPLHITRLCQITARAERAVLGRTEHDEHLVVELDTGRLAVWLLDGWLHALGKSGGTDLRARDEAARLGHTRVARELHELLDGRHQLAA